MVLELISGDVLVKRGAVLFWTKQPKSTMLMCHEFISVEKKFLVELLQWLGKPTGHLCRRHDPSRGVSNHLWNIKTASCLQYTKCIVEIWFLALPLPYFASLFGASHCPLSHRDWCIFREYIQLRGRTSSCSPTHKPIISLKTATIPTYLAFP